MLNGNLRLEFGTAMMLSNMICGGEKQKVIRKFPGPLHGLRRIKVKAREKQMGRGNFTLLIRLSAFA